MTPQSISDIIEFLTRNELHAFSIEDTNGKDKFDGFLSEKNTTDTVQRFNEISGKLPTGTYKIRAWKIGGQGNPYTRFFAIGTPNLPNAMALMPQDSNLMYRLGRLETELQMQQEFARLHRKFDQVKRKKVLKSQPAESPLMSMIVGKLMDSPIIQSKIASLMDSKEGQEFILKLNGVNNQTTDEEEDDDDDDDDDEDDENDN